MLLRKEKQKRLADRGKLSGEQNAFISGCLALFFAIVVVVWLVVDDAWHGRVNGDRRGMELSLGFRDGLATVCAGCVHFLAYYSTLQAYNQVSSTVITPLLQLSAVILLPLHSAVAAWKGVATIRPHHLAAVALILCGGCMPISNGHLRAVLTRGFWAQPAVRACLLGEVLVACYNLVLHEETYGRQHSALAVFAWSRLGNFVACATLFALHPTLKYELRRMRKVSWRFLSICLFGELMSVGGLLVVTFSYAAFYEPAVVNAAEGGLQQLFNLLLAAALVQVSRLSFLPPWVRQLARPLSDMRVKVASLGLISVGLALSAA